MKYVYLYVEYSRLESLGCGCCGEYLYLKDGDYPIAETIKILQEFITHLESQREEAYKLLYMLNQKEKE